MAAYTLFQLLEVLVAIVILLIGVLKGWPPVSLLGGGFLIAIAIVNILAPEGGTIYRRSLIGYAVAALFVLGGVIAAHFGT